MEIQEGGTKPKEKPKSTLETVLGPSKAGARTSEALQLRVEQAKGKEEYLKRQIASADAKIEDLRKAIISAQRDKAKATGKGAAEAGLSASRGVEKAAKFLEQLLARLRKLDDTRKAELKVMKGRIDHLRQEAMDRTETFDLRAKEVESIKLNLVSALEKSNIVLNARNEVSDRLKAVRAQAEHDLQVYKEQEASLQSELTVLQKEMIQAAAKVASTDRDEEEGPGSGEMTEEQEAEARHNIRVLEGRIKEYEAAISALHEQTRQLQEVFKHMIAQAGLQTLDDLVDMFAKQEAFKYEIFGYVAHTNSETKQYQEMLRDVQDARAKYLEELVINAKEEENKVSRLQQELHSLEQQQQSLEANKVALYSGLSTLIHSVLRVYTAAGGRNLTLLQKVTDEELRKNQNQNQLGRTSALESVTKPTLALSRDDTIRTLADIEQLSTEVCRSIITMARSPVGNAHIVNGQKLLEESMLKEVARLKNAGLYDADKVLEANKAAKKARKDYVLNGKYWQELSDEHGGKYYWNKRSGDTVWDPPPELPRCVFEGEVVAAKKELEEAMSTAQTEEREIDVTLKIELERKISEAEAKAAAEPTYESLSLLAVPDLEVGYTMYSPEARARYELLSLHIKECADARTNFAKLGRAECDSLEASILRVPGVPARAVNPIAAPKSVMDVVSPELSSENLTLAPLNPERKPHQLDSASEKKKAKDHSLEQFNSSMESIGSMDFIDGDKAQHSPTKSEIKGSALKSKKRTKDPNSGRDRGFGTAARFIGGPVASIAPTLSSPLVGGPSFVTVDMSISSLSQGSNLYHQQSSYLPPKSPHHLQQKLHPHPFIGKGLEAGSPAFHASPPAFQPAGPKVVQASEVAALLAATKVQELLVQEAIRREEEAKKLADEKTAELLRLRAIAMSDYLAGTSDEGINSAPIQPPNPLLVEEYKRAQMEAIEAEKEFKRAAEERAKRKEDAAAAARARSPEEASPTHSSVDVQRFIQLSSDKPSAPVMLPMTPRRGFRSQPAGHSGLGLPGGPTNLPAFEVLRSDDVPEFEVMEKRVVLEPRMEMKPGAHSPYVHALPSSPMSSTRVPPSPRLTRGSAEGGGEYKLKDIKKESLSRTPSGFASRPGKTLAPPSLQKL